MIMTQRSDRERHVHGGAAAVNDVVRIHHFFRRALLQVASDDGQLSEDMHEGVGTREADTPHPDHGTNVGRRKQQPEGLFDPSPSVLNHCHHVPQRHAQHYHPMLESPKSSHATVQTPPLRNETHGAPTKDPNRKKRKRLDLISVTKRGVSLLNGFVVEYVRYWIITVEVVGVS